jgi:pyruvate carboxylase
MYKKVNDMVGDIVKVTPSSKMVGDMAIFMVKNDLTPDNIVEKARGMAFPDSVTAYFKGMMGQPMGGFPKDLQKLVLKKEEPITCRPGELLPPEDLDKIKKYLDEKYDMDSSMKDILSYALYPDVFEEYIKNVNEYEKLKRMGSDIFFHGLNEGETCEIEVSEGKVLIVKLLEIGKLDSEGKRAVEFEVNGNRKEIKIQDKLSTVKAETIEVPMADPSNKYEIGSSIPGTVVKVLVKEGDTVEEDQNVIVVEAMKMETIINTSVPGAVKKVLVKEGQQVKTGQALMILE